VAIASPLEDDVLPTASSGLELDDCATTTGSDGAGDSTSTGRDAITSGWLGAITSVEAGADAMGSMRSVVTVSTRDTWVVRSLAHPPTTTSIASAAATAAARPVRV
jgi:hypothetical protein